MKLQHCNLIYCKQRAQITVFMALMLSVLIIFSAGLIRNVDRYSVKSEISLAVMSALKSCFAEYNKRLFETYHILYIDPSYKGIDNDPDILKSHFINYIASNIDTEITGVSEDERITVDFLEIRRACDDEWSDFICQIAGYLAEEGLPVSSDTRDILISYSKIVFGNKLNARTGVDRNAELEYLIYGYEDDFMNMRQAEEDYRVYMEPLETDDFIVEDYMGFLDEKLCELSEDTILMRVTKLIEEDLRYNESPGFVLTDCIYKVSVYAKVYVGQFDEYEIKRSCSYSE